MVVDPIFYRDLADVFTAAAVGGALATVGHTAERRRDDPGGEVGERHPPWTFRE
jgi:hypothetical protein